MTIVIKLGGSLLNLPNLSDTLQTVLSQRSDQRCLIVSGGGATADVVREWSRVHSLDDETGHLLAIASLELNRRLLEQLLGFRSVVSRAEALLAWNRDSTPLLLDTEQFLAAEEAEVGRSIPHNWEVTSDSLAAWIAVRWPADELVLLKSVPAPLGVSTIDAGVAELVDTYFAHLAPHLPLISWSNLRASAKIQPWLSADRNARSTLQMNQND